VVIGRFSVRSYIVYFAFSNELKHVLQAFDFSFTGAVFFSADEMSVGVQFPSADGLLYSVTR
jgi:hypothetical protein